MPQNQLPMLCSFLGAGLGLKTPVFAVDARVKNDVSLLVQALLYSLDPGLEEDE